MLQKNVKIGETYLTKIGGELRRVRVDQQVTRTEHGYRSGDRQVTRFRVTELRSGKTLPKLRAAASLREIPQPIEQAVHCKWCRQSFPIVGDRGKGSNDPALEAAQQQRDTHEHGCEKNPDRFDVHVVNHGTLHSFSLLTAEALAWVHENVRTESYLWQGKNTLLVEHRYSQPLAEGLQAAGFIVR